MGVVAGRFTPSSSSSLICFSTAIGSRPVQPAMTACAMGTSDGCDPPRRRERTRDTGFPSRLAFENDASSVAGERAKLKAAIFLAGTPVPTLHRVRLIDLA